MLKLIGAGTATTRADLAKVTGLARSTISRRVDAQAIGIGVPGPVEFATGRPTNPPIMPGWNEYPVPEFFAGRYDVTVLVDNDVNVMALGEQRDAYAATGYLLFVKVGTGIGCGIVAGGRLHRGAQGSAGDIGHIRVSGHEDAGCRCGNSQPVPDHPRADRPGRRRRLHLPPAGGDPRDRRPGDRHQGRPGRRRRADRRPATCWSRTSPGVWRARPSRSRARWPCRRWWLYWSSGWVTARRPYEVASSPGRGPEPCRR
ncbi:ROK family protein [Spongiactinospora sp. TRM90649]|uniref:ROK family protein n=1 Tax=Spongiactinospora sp. TRM90649 TaxID=3031114 RepID=UPI0023F93AA5|nr:ROK family protein [Spongiactinospora sp. TRM90649]MDF5756437.1 ROK family protein [Spongiactinospora sp. TRM90649]